MKKELIDELFQKFEEARYLIEGTEYWSARELQSILGYAKWGNFFNTIDKTIPLVRIFDEQKARECYCDWLGFQIDWEHRFEEGMPLYMQVSLGNLTLHRSEHAGDCTPGGKVFLRCTGLRAWHQIIAAKNYKYYRPSVEDAFWGGICMYLTDPFGNKLLFSENEQT